MMKKVILKISLGLIGILGLMLPVQAATIGQTTGQVRFYQGATAQVNQQAASIDQQIPNGETAYAATIAKTAATTKGRATPNQVATIPGWLTTTNSNLRLPQTDEARTTYWLVLGTMLLLIAGLLKLIQQTHKGEEIGHGKS